MQQQQFIDLQDQLKRVTGNLLPFFRSVRLKFLQHMVSCCFGRQGFGEWQRGTTCTVWRKLFK